MCNTTPYHGQRPTAGGELYDRCLCMLERESIFGLLSEFDPVWAGTIPIGCSIEGSDIDIVCHADDIDAFMRRMEGLFGRREGFEARRRNASTAVCRFVCDGMPVEIFVSDVPSRQSNGYRHMEVERRVLALADGRFRNAVVELKRTGMKTEPAFARLLGLEGDAYESVLALESCSDAEIRRALGEYAK